MRNYRLFYGKLSSLALDPIEKKPLYEFCPGSKILSVGFFGCNMSCGFCQNHDISHPEDMNLRYMECSPKRLLELARSETENDNIGMAFTYNEALINYEYVEDTARLVRNAGMVNVLVTNGNAHPAITDRLLPLMDAMNIDLKGFRQEIYRAMGGDLETVKGFIEMSAAKTHVELTSLIVPGMNDSPEDMEKQAGWIAGLEERYNKSIPLHITRFFPRYRMSDAMPTDIGLMEKLKEIAEKYLHSVYLGNI